MGARANITSDLASQVDAAEDSNLLDVVVELDSEREPAPDIASAKEQFSRAAEPVAEAISGMGGEVMGGAWINYTLRARVPAAGVPTVAGLDRVAVVDVPHAIQHD